jgi:hypothetical protein
MLVDSTSLNSMLSAYISLCDLKKNVAPAAVSTQLERKRHQQEALLER